MITELIDKQDNVEIARDQIAAILKLESTNQVALATAASEPDPNLWKLRVFVERTNIWENMPSKDSDDSPVINVWWDTSTYDKKGSNVFERQLSNATINIDCFGYGTSSSDGTGQKAGDKEAALTVQRAARLVRNILMAAEYVYLGMRGVVGERWPSSITNLQPQQDNTQVEHVVAARIVLNVQLNEFAPQVEPVELELLSVLVKRTEDDEVVIEADYDYLNEDF